MKRILVSGLFFALFFIPAQAKNKSDREPVLWYSQPASGWLEAQPAGNGSLEEMIAGNTVFGQMNNQSASGTEGKKTLFNSDWRFSTEEVSNWRDIEFDDSKWQEVDLPHDFSIYGPFISKDEKGAGLNGYRPFRMGFYRKSFLTPPNLEKKRFWLEFEGVYQVAQVFINGKKAAENINGYIGFECDITSYLNPVGQSNLVAISADNRQPETSRWYTGGGIYRHVWQKIRGEIYVIENGVFVTTPKISDEEALLNIQTEVKNESDKDQWVTLISRIIDPKGSFAAETKSLVPVRKGEIFTYKQQIRVEKPLLWDISAPDLYQLVSIVQADSLVTDKTETFFGIREIYINPNGLFLNGKRVFVKGFNIHHDNGCLGAAAFDRAIERRLQLIKEIGCNAIRLSHNPHAPALLDMCDRLGLLVFNEAYDKWNGQFYRSNEEFDKLWPKDLERFIRRDRNHPGVFIWSMGNETGGFNGPDYGIGQYDAMAGVARRIDPTRPVTIGLFPMRKDGGREGVKQIHPNWRSYEPHQLAFHSDVMSANYMESYFANDRLKYPQLSYIASESSTANGGRNAWNELDKDHAVGLFYWGGIDYLGEAIKWPQKGWLSGFIGRTGFRKTSSWDVQSILSDKPMIHLAILDIRPENLVSWTWNEVKITNRENLSHWNFEGQKLISVEAYTNCDEAELFLNNRSLGIIKRQDVLATGQRFKWSVPFTPGSLVAVGRNGGMDAARHELKTAGSPTAIRLTPDKPEMNADCQDLCHIRVEIIDNKGVVVPGSDNLIKFEVTGAGTIAGVDNDDPITGELFQSNQRSAFRGIALLVVRSKQTAGKIYIRASAKGLKPAEIELETK